MNPFLRKLGFSATDRVVIIHADDVGLCGATVTGLRDLITADICKSASLMVPCSWFPAAATACREMPDADFGIHLTLTSEWPAYRWRPLSTVDPQSGLLDPDGYLWNVRRNVAAHAESTVVRTEMRAQVEHARRNGVDVTHLDAHMFTAFDARYIVTYADLGRELQLPILLVRSGLERHNFDEEACALAQSVAEEWEADGLPLFDRIALMGLQTPEEDRVLRAKQKIEELPRGGLGMLLLHPAVASQELLGFATDWRARLADQEAFRQDELREYLTETNTHVITYRTLRDAM